MICAGFVHYPRMVRVLRCHGLCGVHVLLVLRREPHMLCEFWSITDSIQMGRTNAHNNAILDAGALQARRQVFKAPERCLRYCVEHLISTSLHLKLEFGFESLVSTAHTRHR
jgi:hypothetical protein